MNYIGQAPAATGSGGQRRWVDEAASRTVGATYTNNTTQELIVKIYSWSSASVSSFFNFTVDEITIGISSQAWAASAQCTGEFVVPPGSTYRISVGYGSAPVNSWFEFKVVS